MTRLALIADIHGNLPALDAVLADLARFPVDQIIVAGDVINWGPFSAQVLERVVSAGWPVIRGNNEFYLLDYGTPRAPAAWADPGQWPLLPWLHRQLNGRWQKVIAVWPDTLSLRFPDAPPLCVVHGSPRSAFESMLPINTDAELLAMRVGVAETTLVAAHTHLPMERRVGNYHLLNCGSVGMPLDGQVGRACYLLLEGSATGWHPTWRYVTWDPQPVLAEFARQGFVDECGVIGHLVLAEYHAARLKVTPFLRWRAATCPTAPLGLDLLESFSQANIWDYTPPDYHLNR